jgi:microcystin-dependent protein
MKRWFIGLLIMGFLCTGVLPYAPTCLAKDTSFLWAERVQQALANSLDTDGKWKQISFADGTVLSGLSDASPQDIGEADAGTGTEASRDDHSHGGPPAGSILLYGGSVAPDGWLLCDGTTGKDSVADTTLANLFIAIGTTFGGTGADDFDLPDMRGRLPLGKDNMGGSSANRVTDSEADNIGQGSGDEAALIAHDHSHNHGYDKIGGGSIITIGVGNKDTVGAVTDTDATSAGSGSSSMNPYLTLNYIIKT